MKNKEAIIERQKEFIQEIKNKVSDFINSIDKSEIETILLSGSLSRGDFFPRIKDGGDIDGMVDLIVMRKKGSSIKAEDVFGPDQEPQIPFHCVKVNNLWYEILFTDFIDADTFTSYDEPKKFSVLESQILYDANGSYKNELEKNKGVCKRRFKEQPEQFLGLHSLSSFRLQKRPLVQAWRIHPVARKPEHSNPCRNPRFILFERLLFSSGRQGNLLFPQPAKTPGKI